jgi:N-acetylmuramoyl-L-alanine amidase
MTRIDFIAIHCSATPAGRDHDAADIDRWHRSRGFRQIGYHYVIKRDGTVEKGRPDDRPGAHARKINRRSISVCLIGGSPPIGSREHRKGLGENNFTDEQWASLAELVTTLSDRYPDAEVLGHRDVPGVRKACPAFDVKDWWAQTQTHRRETDALRKGGCAA